MAGILRFAVSKRILPTYVLYERLYERFYNLISNTVGAFLQL